MSLSLKDIFMGYRVGIGYDIHHLVKNRKLILGGVNIPSSQGLLGHSDGDVLLHAISDAFLGALSQGDLGKFFPDSNPKYKGISSILILRKIYNLIKEKGYKVNNIDTVVIAERPQLEPYKDKISESIASILKVGKNIINIKAKTNEGLGPVGKKQAIAAYAVVSLKG